MGRTYIKTFDRAEKLAEYAFYIAEIINDGLAGAKLHSNGWPISAGDILHTDEKDLTGFFSAWVEFDKKEPAVTTEGMREAWYRSVMETAGKRFGFKKVGPDAPLTGKDWPFLEGNLYYYSIHYSEESEEKLYELDTRKKLLIRKGFKTFGEYINWYISVVSKPESVIPLETKLVMPGVAAQRVREKSQKR